MKDLLLDRLLSAPEIDPPALLPLLAELAHLPLAERFPLLGLIPRVLAHPDPALRAAALGALAGADGRPAFLHLVAALGDADPTVRRAAVDALRVSVVGHPARFAHALFHPQEDVRRAAIAGEWPQGVAAFTFPLLADPACRADLLARFDARRPPGEESLEPPAVLPSTLPALFDFVARGLLPRARARQIVADMSWDHVVRWLRKCGQRSEEAIDTVLATAAKGPPPLVEPDPIDDLLALFWDEIDEGPKPRREAFFRRLAGHMLGWSGDLRRRAVASLLVTAAGRAAWPSAAAGIAAVFHPPFLGFPWVPRAERLAAVSAIYAAGSNAPRLDDDAVKALLALDLCRRDDGHLDLHVIGGLLHFVESGPYTRLLQWVDERTVVASFLADVDHAIPFLVLRDDGKRGRDYLVDCVAAAGGFSRAMVNAILVVASPVDRLDFLDPLAGEEAAAVVVELVRVLRRMGTDLPPKKTSALQPLVQKVAAHIDLVRRVLSAWLDAAEPAQLGFGVGVLGMIGVEMQAERFVTVAEMLPLPLLRALLGVLPSCSMFPYGKEMALAHALREHDDPEVRGWAVARAPPAVVSFPVGRSDPEAPAVRPLSSAEVNAVVTSSERDLPAAVEPCLAEPTSGLCDALARRPPPLAASVKVCVAVLGSHDPMERVDAEMARFGNETPAFLSSLDAEMVRTWEREANLPPLGHALIHRWERHAFAVVEGFLAARGLGAQLSRAAALSQEILRVSVWEATASAFMMWRWRDREKLAPLCTQALGEQLVSALDTDLGEPAARMLAAIADARVAPALVEALRPAITEKLPDLTPSVRQRLAAIADARGITGSGIVRPANEQKIEEDVRAKIRASVNLDDLEAWCRGQSPTLVEDATIRLCELGEAGCARIFAVILAGAPIMRPLLDSVSLWHDGASLAAARAFVARDGESPELRFRIAIALAQRGERDALGHALAAACVETSEPWFKADDWARLLSFGYTERALALALSAAPHPHAYRRAIGRLLDVPTEAITDEVIAAMAAFLEAGTNRHTELRHKVARWLRRCGDDRAFVVLLGSTISPQEGHLAADMLAGAHPDRVAAAVEAFLVTGPRAAPERTTITLLRAAGVDPDARAHGYERMLADAMTPAVREWAASFVRSEHRSEKLRILAETFAWGIRTGRSLTGRLFKVEMTTGPTLGYTRLEESRVFVSPLPILRRVPHGRAIVEGLILHELGHHLYHRGEEGTRAWKQAEKEGIFGLLNTVADEHLERNLRGVDAEFGDRLKRLGAHAFLHADKDVPVTDLLQSLGGSAFEVLTATRLDVAREDPCVRVASGAILQHMERAGLAFSRFFRALRMGLGDRHGDPLVSRGLALCKGIRKRTMPELLDLARKLRALFGWQTQLVESLGPHETFEGSSTETMIDGDGITKEELEREIERVLDPDRKKRDAAGAGGPNGRAWININPDERFDLIRSIVKVPRDPSAHARYAGEVAFAARQMRRFLDALGLTLEPERFRLRGRRFDAARALAVVTRGDPRMLVAREPRIRTDLYLAVIIDCSGSMQTRDNIEKARLFGAMLAEAARGVRGVDLRLFGFNDHTMFDAGDANHCAVHGLTPGGGNNDAGALFYVAQEARQSRRKAKLLVMISDGLPTECSVSSLRALVARLGSRYGMCCAQVAVQPLTEVCFPNYIELSESDPAPAVRRFGAIIAGLVRKAMALG
ncbi:MAG: VWA domain-containing protein [Minicystis sp.]